MVFTTKKPFFRCWNQAFIPISIFVTCFQYTATCLYIPGHPTLDGDMLQKLNGEEYTTVEKEGETKFRNAIWQTTSFKKKPLSTPHCQRTAPYSQLGNRAELLRSLAMLHNLQVYQPSPEESITFTGGPAKVQEYIHRAIKVGGSHRALVRVEDLASKPRFSLQLCC